MRKISTHDGTSARQHGAFPSEGRAGRWSGRARLGLACAIVVGLGAAAAATVFATGMPGISLSTPAPLPRNELREGLRPDPQALEMADADDLLGDIGRFRSSGLVTVGSGSLFDATIGGPSTFVRMASLSAARETVSARAMPMPAANPLFAARIPQPESGSRITLPDALALVSAPLPESNPLLRTRRQLASLSSPERPPIDEPAPAAPKSGQTELPAPGSGFALYDIKGKTVYMPNGERLEAHSGYGEMFDDPRFVHRKMVGPTPPNIYSLKMREALFHGVEAIRLTPVGNAKMYGRDGLLAHTYLLGPRGDSNGCISFREYEKFLAAYRRGEISRLVVVAELENAPQPANSLLSWLLPK